MIEHNHGRCLVAQVTGRGGAMLVALVHGGVRVRDVDHPRAGGSRPCSCQNGGGRGDQHANRQDD